MTEFVGQDDLKAQELLARIAEANRVVAACVGRERPANGAAAFGRERQRKLPAFGKRCGLCGLNDAAGFGHHGEGLFARALGSIRVAELHAPQ